MFLQTLTSSVAEHHHSNIVQGDHVMDRIVLVNQLKSQSTWRLFFLSLVTFGIYMAYYMKRQTKNINQHLDKERQISGALVTSMLIVSYVAVILAIIGTFVDYMYTINAIGFILDNVYGVLALVWAFKARNRMNTLIAATKDHADWFDIIWTLLFLAVYFNFKINKLNEYYAKQII
jgi:hypothetical protein